MKTQDFVSRKATAPVFIIGCLLVAIIVSGCAKVKTTKTYTITNAASQSTIASDEVIVNNALSQYVDDAIAVLSNHNASIAGAYPADSVSSGCYEITYNGKLEPDGVEARTGVDSIHINPKVAWGTPGSTAMLTFKDVNAPTGYEVFYYSKIPPSADTASLTFSGTITITNVNGFLLQNVTGGDSLVVQIRANNVAFTFNDQASNIQFFPLSINEKRTFTMTNSILYASTRGDTTLSGYSNIGTWGTDRLGSNYYSSISAPVVQNISNLNLSYNPLSGTKIIEGIAEPITCRYGVNNQGQGDPVSSGNPYGVNITWVDNGVQASVVLPYYY